MKKYFGLTFLFALALYTGAYAQAPDPRDSIILESKTVMPGAAAGATSDTSAYVYQKVWITNKDTVTSLNLALIETSTSGGAYAVLAQPRTFDGMVSRLTSTLTSGIFNVTRYHSNSPDSFLLVGVYDPLDPATVEPPNATRKAFWEIKYDSVPAVLGTVTIDSGRVFQSTYFTNTVPSDVRVNFVPGVLQVQDDIHILNCLGATQNVPSGQNFSYTFTADKPGSWSIVSGPGSINSSTGQYDFNVDCSAEQFPVTVKVTSQLGAENVCSFTLTVQHELTITGGLWTGVRGRWVFFDIQYSNIVQGGDCPFSPTIVLTLPSQLPAQPGYWKVYPEIRGPSHEVVGQVVNAVTDYDARTVTLDLPSVSCNLGCYRYFVGEYFIPCEIPAGTALTLSAQIGPLASDFFPPNNTISRTQLVGDGGYCNLLARSERAGIASKVAGVAAEGDIFGKRAIDTITYLVSFLNLKGGTTTDLVVRDSLDSNLNVASFDSLATSHPYTFSAVGRELTWTFSGINLPDTATDRMEGTGFAAFRVLVKPGVPEGTPIPNEAVLTFDSGTPYVTPPVEIPACAAAPGDINGDGGLTPSDVVVMLNCTYLSSGACSACDDNNCDGNLTPSDVVLELNAVYLGVPVSCL